MRRILPLLAAAGLTLAACADRRADVLAIYRGGDLALADLDAYVRSLPEPQRVAPADLSRAAWLDELLRGLALERLLATSETVQKSLASAATRTRRRWAIAGQLAAAVTLDLASTEAPDASEVAELPGEEAAVSPPPLYDFRHVFLRLDRAEDEAGRQAVRRLAASIARRAQQGEDFAALAREHSQSSTAAGGGLVQGQRLALLDESVRRALEPLAEGEVSPVVESRTGLHVLRLERRLAPRPEGRQRQRQRALFAAAQERRLAARDALLGELRQRFEVATDSFPWRVGSFEVTAAEVEAVAGRGNAEGRSRELAVEQLLLAEEGRRRGLLTPELEAEVDLQLRRQAIQEGYLQRRAAYVAAIPAERLRSLYDARPAAYATPETAHLDLIFVPQGNDAFATQRRLEDHVERLRAGESFAELARRISSGPAAADGGDLGWLPPSEWVRLGPEIYTAVAAMEPGEISAPVYQTDRILSADHRTLRGGFAVLRLRARKPAAARAFEEVVEDLRAVYARQHAAEIDREVRQEILAEAGFEIVRHPTPDELLP